MNITAQADPAQAPASKTRMPLLNRSRIIAAVSAVGGMIVGSIVGVGVQAGVESMGLLGPSMESLIAEQEENFNDVRARLDALSGMSTDPEVRQSFAELGTILQRQSELSAQAGAELRYLGEQVSTLKEQQLAESGFAGGADFWLKGGESVSVGGANQVFALIRTSGANAQINLSGARQWVAVGDVVSVSGDEQACQVFYKHATPRSDGRIGFDIACS